MGFMRCLSGWCWHPTQLCIYFGGVYSPKALCGNALLGQEDSNLHSQNQNLMYCHYTIAQCDGWLVGFEPTTYGTTIRRSAS